MNKLRQVAAGLGILAQYSDEELPGELFWDDQGLLYFTNVDLILPEDLIRLNASGWKVWRQPGNPSNACVEYNPDEIGD